LEEVAVRAGHEVSMEVHDKSSLIVGNSQGVLYQQFRLHPMHLLYVLLYFKYFILNYLTGDHPVPRWKQKS
jgi:hypothetical protein